MTMLKQLNDQFLKNSKKSLTHHYIDLNVNFLRLQKIMVDKIHSRSVIQVPRYQPQYGHLSDKKDNLAVQYEDCPWVVDEFRQWNFMILHLAQARFLAKNQMQSNEITKFGVLEFVLANCQKVPKFHFQIIHTF